MATGHKRPPTSTRAETVAAEESRQISINKPQHFVLVHGAGHGAWTWYKLKPRLEAAGHRATVLDLAASGVNRRSIEEVFTFSEYSQPLLNFLRDSVPPGERVVLVGHSLGGLSVALAADMFSDKVAAVVFLTAFVPDTVHKPSYVLEQYMATAPKERWRDTVFRPYGDGDQEGSAMIFGPQFLSLLYQLSPGEDLELAKTLVRPSSLFINDLSSQEELSDDGFGSVTRVFIVCNEDKGIPEEFQRWMIRNSGIENVAEIGGADHMPMFSKTQELCQCLLVIANKYT
ncbi:hypothetical protein SAY87_020404 [Trapa incisa]|uniref:AB hydrolase-1 domain-containing protein n=1 Tax=Trapa incisa TaxID=236973 RepID=A0AAN7K0Q0_9MYRT|nr:hypothetical protein SAY87_020404 [Trapa incisa]